MKLRNPNLWKLEGGQEEDQALFETMESEISSENERRQRGAGGELEM